MNISSNSYQQSSCYFSKTQLQRRYEALVKGKQKIKASSSAQKIKWCQSMKQQARNRATINSSYDLMQGHKPFQGFFQSIHPKIRRKSASGNLFGGDTRKQKKIQSYFPESNINQHREDAKARAIQLNGNFDKMRNVAFQTNVLTKTIGFWQRKSGLLSINQIKELDNDSSPERKGKSVRQVPKGLNIYPVKRSINTEFTQGPQNVDSMIRSSQSYTFDLFKDYQMKKSSTISNFLTNYPSCSTLPTSKLSPLVKGQKSKQKMKTLASHMLPPVDYGKPARDMLAVLRGQQHRHRRFISQPY